MHVYVLLGQSKEGDDTLDAIGCWVFTSLDAARKHADDANTDDEDSVLEWHADSEDGDGLYGESEIERVEIRRLLVHEEAGNDG